MPKSAKQCEKIRQQMREKILYESMLYFARNGFAGTKIGDLAKRIGIGQGTIYLYFSSKEELFQEIREMAVEDKDLQKMKQLAYLPFSARRKIHLLSVWVLKRLKTDERFAGMMALSTQITLEQKTDSPLDKTAYQSELYRCMEAIIKQGQNEGSVVDGSPIMLADYYWGVVYLYAIKKLFTTSFEMIGTRDLERTVLKSGMVEKKQEKK